MYAIVRKENGGYYTSTVFGYFTEITADDEYHQYLEGINNRFYVVLNEEKTALTAQVVFPAGRSLDPRIIIIDAAADDWIIHSSEYSRRCSVGFLDPDKLPEQVMSGTIDKELLERCIEEDRRCRPIDCPEVTDDTSLENLGTATGWFHDAYIAEYHECPDNSLYVLFKGCWGCSVEMWFSDCVSYNIPDYLSDNPYWNDAALVFQDGFIFLIDDDVAPEQMYDGYCYFKSKQLKYHIIPNEHFSDCDFDD